MRMTKAPAGASGCYACTRRLRGPAAAAIVEKIQATAKGDLLGQMQLAEAVKRRLSPANFEPDKDLYVALAIAESIRAWMKELKSKYHGRFPNDVRAAYRAVHQAVATSCSDPLYKAFWTQCRCRTRPGC